MENVLRAVPMIQDVIWDFIVKITDAQWVATTMPKGNPLKLQC